MFKNLEILANKIFIYEYKYTKEEIIEKIEDLLKNNKDLLSIFKNENNSYSIFDNKDLDEYNIADPIITFFEEESLIHIYNTLELYVKTNKVLNNTIKNYQEKLKKTKEENNIYMEALNNRIKDFNNLIYPDKEESKELHKIISLITENEDYDCADNYRFAKIGDRYQEYIFKNIEESGCCGSHERKIKFKGEDYKIGFNYGH